MQFCHIWLRGVRDIFTWHAEQLSDEKNSPVSAGARVVVKFRNRKRVGIVVGISEKKPDFKTQPILEIWDENFLPTEFLEIAKNVAEEQFCSVQKILGMMVPEKFLLQKNPEIREKFFSLSGTEFENLRGKNQKLVVEKLLKIPEISESELRKIASLATIRGLLEKNILQIRVGKIIPAATPNEKVRENFALTPAQKIAFDQISKTKKPSVLFGVTGSGKTEIYKKLAQQILEKNPDAQVLFLLPEIALTPQLIAEFRAQLGDFIAVWHSNLSVGEKIQEWARCRSGEAKILIGARSAAWVPLQNPKLIILDEEHEWTFKSEFAPRIWTHELVEKIAEKFCAKIVFGSATPRLESFQKCAIGEWDQARLVDRVHAVKMPDIQFVDLKNEGKKGNFTPISEWLADEISKMLERKKQGILFLNRRGFSGSTQCRKCGENVGCPNCSSPMKLHKNFEKEKMLCHVCGYLKPVPEKCPTCGAADFQFRGWGTQQVEKVLGEKFPGIRVLRADADSVSGRYDFEKILQKFHAGDADLLLGTQMIAKGLDFENVELVGVILADVGLGLPDFRADERVFQLLTQVSGRAGRRKTQGKILIQTFRPEEPLFQFVRNHDTENFIADQISDRKNANLPPFSVMAKITFSHADKNISFRESKKFFALAQKSFSTGGGAFSKKNPPPTATETSQKNSSVGVQWAPAFFPKSHGKFHFHVFLRAPDRKILQEFLSKNCDQLVAKIDLFPASLL
ncbi:primosomal protein N' [bacterium]|jgi:primosomal protein N' (replication factor Y) (superfamily II helicase)|nr:primosomal protein N' [bacterium]MBT6832412.1 primosomal protein N' [bacterium]MBT6996083.1 primosomal protein N' [bacterium]MBT7772532.1 primosomal protein N' [bacterium]